MGGSILARLLARHERRIVTAIFGGSGVQEVDPKLRRGQFREASTNEDLARVIANGVPGTGMPPFTLQPSEITALVAFIRAGFDPTARPVRVGDAARGQAGTA